MNYFRTLRLARIVAFSVFLTLLASTPALQASTKLEIVIVREPDKDPSSGQVGTTLSIATPPSDGKLFLVWSTTDTGVGGVHWQVRTAGLLSSVVLSGTTKPSNAANVAVPGAKQWFSIDTTFLTAKAPVKPVSYQITVTPFEANNKRLGATSNSVMVTQEIDKSPNVHFNSAQDCEQSCQETDQGCEGKCEKDRDSCMKNLEGALPSQCVQPLNGCKNGCSTKLTKCNATCK
jgi:hypothetical protein